MKFSSASQFFLFAAALLLPAGPAQSSQDFYSQQELRQCVSYHQTMEKKKGNVRKLEDILDEIDEKISYYDRKLNDIEGEIQYSSGSQRNSLIDQYDYLLAKRNDYSNLYNTALDKQELRASQHDKTVKLYNNQCFGKSAKVSDLDLICPERKGYCAGFK